MHKKFFLISGCTIFCFIMIINTSIYNTYYLRAIIFIMILYIYKACFCINFTTTRTCTRARRSKNVLH